MGGWGQWVVGCLLGKSRGRVLKNISGLFVPRFQNRAKANGGGAPPPLGEHLSENFAPLSEFL